MCVPLLVPSRSRLRYVMTNTTFPSSNKHHREMIATVHSVDKDFNLEISDALTQAATELGIRNISHIVTRNFPKKPKHKTRKHEHEQRLLPDAGPGRRKGQDGVSNRDTTYSFPLFLTPLVEAMRATSPPCRVERSRRALSHSLRRERHRRLAR